jgi:heptosyltransferase-2
MALQPTEKVMKILIIQTSFLGDTILSTPVISGVRQLYPKAELWMMTTPLAADLISRDPLLAGVIPYDKRRRDSGIMGLLRMAAKIRAMKFDRVYALQRSLRTTILCRLAGIPFRVGFRKARLSFLFNRVEHRNPAEHDVIRNLSILRSEIAPEACEGELRLFAPESKDVPRDTREVCERLPRYVALFPGSAWFTKRWHAEGYRIVADQFLKQDYGVVVLGGPDETEVCAKVSAGLSVDNLSGRVGIQETMYLVKHASLVVCNDSMAMHMAAAFKVPNVAIYCATSPAFGFSPWRNRAQVVEKSDLGCKPCSRHGSERCPIGTESCMRDLSPAEVLDAARRMLNP